MPDASEAWLTIEVDRSALSGNIAVFRRLVGPSTRLLAVVKADAYGHGLLLAAHAFLAGIRGVAAPFIGLAVLQGLSFRTMGIISGGLALFASAMMIPLLRSDRKF